MKNFAALMLLTVFCSNALADRTLLIPPIRLGALHDFKKDIYGNPTSYSEGTPVMIGVELFISLQNLANEATEGTVEITDTGKAEVLLDAASCCPGRHMESTVSICSNIDGDFKTHLFNSNFVPPKAVKWSMNANGKTYILVSGVFVGRFSLTDSTRFSVALFHFRPTIKMVVKRDRGAVSGTVTAYYLHTDSYPTCDNGNHKTLSGVYGSYPNQQTVQQLISLNGGRPF